MNQLLDKEQLLSDVLKTVETRSDLHAAYKAKMKTILEHCFYDTLGHLAENPEAREIEVTEFISNFVEETFRLK